MEGEWKVYSSSVLHVMKQVLASNRASSTRANDFGVDRFSLAVDEALDE